MIRRLSATHRPTGPHRFARARAWLSPQRRVMHEGRTRDFAARIIARHARVTPWVAAPEMRHRVTRASLVSLHQTDARSTLAFAPRISVVMPTMQRAVVQRVHRLQTIVARRVDARPYERRAAIIMERSPLHAESAAASPALARRLAARGVRAERAPEQARTAAVVKRSAPALETSDEARRLRRRDGRRRQRDEHVERSEERSRDSELSIDRTARSAIRRASRDNSAPAVDIRRVTDEVLRVIDQKIVAQRERMGRR